jgi:ATP-dependent Clp protease ATP-binding subunit ClpC
MDQRFEKFTKEARQALVVAQEKSKEAGLNYIGTEHILIGVLSQANSLGASILMNFGVSLDNVYLVLKTVGRAKAPIDQQTKKSSGFSGFAKQVIEDAMKCGHEFGHNFIGTEHLLFAVCLQKNTAATVILENMKINPEDIRDQIIQIFKRNQENAQQTPMPNPHGASSATMNPLEFFLSGLQGVLSNQNPEMAKEQFKQKPMPTQGSTSSGKERTKTPALDYFCTDMIAEARKGELGPVIGREKEIERIVSILNRKTKNNPVLTGEPGVGKTAVVEGLAHKIVKEEVPNTLLDKRILSLSMASVVAGTKYRGEFEERIKQIIEEASAQKNVILFIDEFHTVIGAGSAEGSLDAANILKPALSRSKLQIIGATTSNEYRKHVEEDPALERRVQPVKVEEPSEEDTVQILKGVREGFEDHHSIVINDEAIDAAVRFSKRYINDRFLPDKAIDLIDEAAALKRMKQAKGSDSTKKLQEELNKIVKNKEESVSHQDYEQAAELRNKEIELMNEIEEARKVVIPRNKRQKLDEEDIARVVSNMTGVPVTRLVKADIDRLMNLENVLKKRLIGQNEAVGMVAQSIRRSRAGISDENRPIASFVFIGPTGVGKTELVRALTEEVYSDKSALIKIDMSEFMERHNTSRLTGTTAGYVGYDEGGSLTEAVRQKPYSVVLFDEIEKAHPDVFNLLLQIMEDGILTDGKGRQVDFKNTIIVMTSNIGADKLTEKAGPIGFDISKDELAQAERDYEQAKEMILEEMKDYFRPEFLNRIDSTIIFNALTHDDVKEIVKLHIDRLQTRIDDKGLKIDLTKAGLDRLAELSFNPEFGARPVRRALQEHVEDTLTQKLLDGSFAEGDTITITATKKGEIALGKKRALRTKNTIKPVIKVVAGTK